MLSELAAAALDLRQDFDSGGAEACDLSESPGRGLGGQVSVRC